MARVRSSDATGHDSSFTPLIVIVTAAACFGVVSFFTLIGTTGAHVSWAWPSLGSQKGAALHKTCAWTSWLITLRHEPSLLRNEKECCDTASRFPCSHLQHTFAALITYLHVDVTGAMPPEVGDLTCLRHLYLGDNQLQGGTDSWIGNEWLQCSCVYERWLGAELGGGGAAVALPRVFYVPLLTWRRRPFVGTRGIPQYSRCF